MKEVKFLSEKRRGKRRVRFDEVQRDEEAEEAHQESVSSVLSIRILESFTLDAVDRTKGEASQRRSFKEREARGDDERDQLRRSFEFDAQSLQEHLGRDLKQPRG